MSDELKPVYDKPPFPPCSENWREELAAMTPHNRKRSALGEVEFQMLINAVWPDCPKDTPFDAILKRAQDRSEFICSRCSHRQDGEVIGESPDF